MKEAMENIQKEMKSVKSNSDTKLKNGMNTLKENMKILRSRIIQIQSKLSLLSDNIGYSPAQKERLNKLYEETTQPQKIIGQVEEISQKMNELHEKTNLVPAVPSEAFNSMTNEEKRRVITILKEQTKGVQCLVHTTKKNAYKLEAMELIVDNIKNASVH